LKMKATLTVVVVVVGFLSWAIPPYGLLFALALAALFLAYGVARSRARRLDPLNDVPNAVRVFLASLAGYLLVGGRGFLVDSLAVALFAASILLNDEYQRRAFDSLRVGRRGGTVVLLGIDGSGKSTHSAKLEEWFRSRGYYCTRVPFHRYLFVDAVSGAVRRDRSERGERRGGNPLRPLLSAFDNLTLNIISSFGRGLEGRVVIYDRYIWSTYVKYEALGYPVRPIRWLYMLPKPRFAVVLDVPVEKSLNVIEERPDHIRYKRAVLEDERSQYIEIARRGGLPVVDATRPESEVQRRLERFLSGVFPNVAEESG